MSSRLRIVRSVSLSSPSANASLILSRPWPGMSTRRSRGIDITAVAPFDGSRRTRIIVSERVGLPCLTSILRRSSPRTRIVCGLPGATSSSSVVDAGRQRRALLADDLRDLLDLEQHGRGDRGRRQDDDHDRADGEALEHGRARARRRGVVEQRSRGRSTRSSAPSRAGLRQPALDRAQRRLLLALAARRAGGARSRPARGGSGAARRSTPTRAGRGGRRRRAELDRRDARLEERDRVGGAVAPDAQRLALDRAADGVAQRAARTGCGARRWPARA